MKKLIKISLLLLLIISYSCRYNNKNEDIKNEKKLNALVKKMSSNRPNLNVSILLDLSDRIDPKKYPNKTMEYYMRDLGYIESITKSFETYIRNKKSRQINDNIQLFLDPEPTDKDLNTKIKELQLSFTRINASKELITKTSKNYYDTSRSIYESAIRDNNFIGSDIWRFFKNRVKDYCVKNEYRNILIVLTDGYLYHKNSKRKEGNRTTYIRPQDIREYKFNTKKWKTKFKKDDYGFISANQDLSNLEVLVLGINPSENNPYEEDVLLEYWKEWFESMKINKYELQMSDLPSNMNRIIENFLFQDNVADINKRN